jgi:hypothetical protein
MTAPLARPTVKWRERRAPVHRDSDARLKKLSAIDYSRRRPEVKVRPTNAHARKDSKITAT